MTEHPIEYVTAVWTADHLSWLLDKFDEVDSAVPSIVRFLADRPNTEVAMQDLADAVLVGGTQQTRTDKLRGQLMLLTKAAKYKRGIQGTKRMWRRGGWTDVQAWPFIGTGTPERYVMPAEVARIVRRLLGVSEPLESAQAPILDPAASFRYFRLSTQYYVAARHAVFCEAMPVAANLAHHAVEMLLFAELARHYTPDQLKSKYHRHHLPSIWAEAKKRLSLVPPASCDKFINDLKDWELIRFPDNPGSRPNSLTLSVGRGSRAVSPPGSSDNTFAYGLEDLDEFVSVVLPKVMAVQGFKAMLRGDSWATYERDNRHMMW